MTYSQASTGLARRGRRLSDTETEERMLGAAVRMISSTGLTVSLDHISFEQMIREADVARSTVYRRWPHKDLFFSDLVKELARNSAPNILAEERALIRRILAERSDWLDSAELRTGLVAELLRRLAVLDFETLSASAAWRTYIALQATFMSLTDENLRRQVAATLAEAERDHRAAVAQAWELMTDLLGYRLRPQLRCTFEDLATLLDATMRGLVLMALPLPELASERRLARPFAGSESAIEAAIDPVTEPADWSLPALGLASIAIGFIEPDPDITWDSDRAERARQELASLLGGRKGPPPQVRPER
jgi:AcrR family transcriptional regulator